MEAKPTSFAAVTEIGVVPATGIEEDRVMTSPVKSEAVKIMKISIKVRITTANPALAIAATTTKLMVINIALHPHFYLSTEIDSTCLAIISLDLYSSFKTVDELLRSTGKS